MFRVPDLIFINNTEETVLALKESADRIIPNVGIVDAHKSSEGLMIPIPGNIDAEDSVNFYYFYMNRIIMEGKLDYFENRWGKMRLKIVGPVAK
jgi:ribosomal protein S2